MVAGCAQMVYRYVCLACPLPEPDLDLFHHKMVCSVFCEDGTWLQAVPKQFTSMPVLSIDHLQWTGLTILFIWYNAWKNPLRPRPL